MARCEVLEDFTHSNIAQLQHTRCGLYTTGKQCWVWSTGGRPLMARCSDFASRHCPKTEWEEFAGSTEISFLS